MSLCAQHSSRPFTDRLLRITSFFLFASILFFGTIFEMHSQSSSTNLLRARAHRAPGSRSITRRNSIRLYFIPSVVEASLLSMPECYLSDLLFFFLIFVFRNFLIKKQIASREKYRPLRSRSIAPATTDAALASKYKKNHLLVCVYARFF